MCFGLKNRRINVKAGETQMILTTGEFDGKYKKMDRRSKQSFQIQSNKGVNKGKR